MFIPKDGLEDTSFETIYQMLIDVFDVQASESYSNIGLIRVLYNCTFAFLVWIIGHSWFYFLLLKSYIRRFSPISQGIQVPVLIRMFS